MFPWEAELFNEYNGERWDDSKKQLVSVDEGSDYMDKFEFSKGVSSFLSDMVDYPKCDRYYVFNKDKLLAEFDWEYIDDVPDRAKLMKDYGLPKFISSNFNSWVKCYCCRSILRSR